MAGVYARADTLKPSRVRGFKGLRGSEGGSGQTPRRFLDASRQARSPSRSRAVSSS
jgi:hypothetical protein